MISLGQAISAHEEWKRHFLKAIEGEAVLDAENIAKDDFCELGKWLHFSEAKEKLRNFPYYKECVIKHAEFHREAGNIAGIINAKKFAEAKAMIASGTPYDLASRAVRTAIGNLKKEAEINMLV